MKDAFGDTDSIGNSKRTNILSCQNIFREVVRSLEGVARFWKWNLRSLIKNNTACFKIQWNQTNSLYQREKEWGFGIYDGQAITACSWKIYGLTFMSVHSCSSTTKRVQSLFWGEYLHYFEFVDEEDKNNITVKCKFYPSDNTGGAAVTGSIFKLEETVAS